PPQDQPAHDRDAVVPADRLVAARTVRGRRDHRPVDGPAERADVQERAEQEPEEPRDHRHEPGFDDQRSPPERAWSRIDPAIPTFSDSAGPRIGTATVSAAADRIRSRTPRPSFPTASAKVGRDGTSRTSRPAASATSSSTPSDPSHAISSSAPHRTSGTWNPRPADARTALALQRS